MRHGLRGIEGVYSCAFGFLREDTGQQGRSRGVFMTFPGFVDVDDVTLLGVYQGISLLRMLMFT